MERKFRAEAAAFSRFLQVFTGGQVCVFFAENPRQKELLEREIT
jgi:hypothetical protein